MPQVRTPAVVLGSMDYGESDRLVTFFTLKLGKLRALAKGAKRSRRRFGANLDLFSLINLYLREKVREGLPLVEEADLLAPRLGLREELERFALASYILELASQLVAERQVNEELFELVNSALDFLEKTGATPGLARGFELKALGLVGMAPELERCLSCQKGLPAKGRIIFSVSKGGPLCINCRGQEWAGLEVASETIIGLRALRDASWEDMKRYPLSPLAAREGKELVAAFLRAQLGRELKSWSFVERLA